MNNKTYWFITAMRDQSAPQWSRQRCWGFFDDFNEAEQAVLSNDGDIYECEYEYVVLEEHHMGTMALGTGNMSWYKYNHSTEKYEKIDAPEWSHGLVHWGIG